MQPEGDKTAAHSGPRASRLGSAFTLVEVIVVMAILILIVTALMTVFSNTQTALRASVTQSDILENGRVTMQLMAADLTQMSPSDYPSNGIENLYSNVNFYVSPVSLFSSPPSPLVQPLVGSASQRTNLLENFFFVSKANVNGAATWVGTGYAVNTNLSSGALYPLYRFYQTTNSMTGTPSELFSSFTALRFTNFAIWSHLMDGVVGLTVRAYDTNGLWLTSYLDNNGTTNTFTNYNASFVGTAANWGEAGVTMYSNAVPASVQVEMDTLEDRSLQRAESLSFNPITQSNYLAGAVTKTHVFRQRITIPLVDPSAY